MLVGAVRIVRSHLGLIPNCSEVPDTMYFVGGGGFGGPGCPPRGQYPGAAKNPLEPPPQDPPFFELGSWGVLSMISDFRESPPPGMLWLQCDSALCRIVH